MSNNNNNNNNNNNATTSVQADSNFRHFANALAKRGYDYAAGYVAGIALGADNVRMTAGEVYRVALDRRALREMIGFAVVATPWGCMPHELLLAAEALDAPGANGEAVAQAKHLVPDLFDLFERKATVELTRAEIHQLLKAEDKLGLDADLAKKLRQAIGK